MEDEGVELERLDLDDDHEPPPEPDEDATAAVAAMADVGRAVVVLRVVAAGAAILWVLGVGSTAWLIWQQSGRFYTAGVPSDPESPTWDRLMQTLASVGTAAWGYLLVAVVALGASALLQSRRLTVLLDAMGDDDESPPPPGATARPGR